MVNSSVMFILLFLFLSYLAAIDCSFSLAYILSEGHHGKCCCQTPFKFHVYNLDQHETYIVTMWSKECLGGANGISILWKLWSYLSFCNDTKKSILKESTPGCCRHHCHTRRHSGRMVRTSMPQSLTRCLGTSWCISLSQASRCDPNTHTGHLN